MSEKPNRFDYIKYDDQSLEDQTYFKKLFQEIENAVESQLKSPRAKALVLTKLEEAYAWVGKAIRDDQLYRNLLEGKVGELQEGRSNE